MPDSPVCRPDCGACCVAASISTPLPGMPDGKPAGVRCIHLQADYRCAIYGSPARPDCCARLRPAPDICGESREEALRLIASLELATLPRVSHSG
ncbi:MAG: YkgJ family cysteine cluster protein [Pseudomonadales bacterium]|nr:YkgJ family cysteine cluster protein [Pseudomonadales bacterium]